MAEKAEAGAELPKQVDELINRKLRQLRRKELSMLLKAKQHSLSELQEKVHAGINARKTGQAFVSVPVAVYGDLVGRVGAVAEAWPGAVWECIRSVLDTTQVIPQDSAAFEALVDEFAWAIRQEPFMVTYIESKPFADNVYRVAAPYGGVSDDCGRALENGLSLKGAAGIAMLRDVGRSVREDTSTAIDEYLLAHRQTASQPNESAPDPGSPTLGSEAKPQEGMPDPTLGSPEWRRENARKAANARHGQTGGSRDKQQRIREIWATGKYSSRDRCAEEECAALGMSFSAARKALRNMP